MSEKSDEQSEEASILADTAETVAALPMVEAPAISPATESEGVPAAAETTEHAAPVQSATQRFRVAAAAQIAAARERLAQRRMLSGVAVAVIAGLTGAFGTALAIAGIGYMTAPADQSVTRARALEESITRIEVEFAALRGNVERSAKFSASQAGKISDRLERIEKAQAEPAIKLSKLTETVEKLRTANAVLPASTLAVAPSRDITGSITPASAPVPMPVAKPQPAAPAIVEGWTLHEIDRDAALIEGKRGLFEVVVGENIPGVGRVEGFRKQDGRWVVVTAKGLIVSR